MNEMRTRIRDSFCKETFMFLIDNTFCCYVILFLRYLYIIFFMFRLT